MDIEHLPDDFNLEQFITDFNNFLINECYDINILQLSFSNPLCISLIS